MRRLDETLRPMVAGLIARAGTAVTIRCSGAPEYDPASGEVTETPIDIALTGVVEDVEVGHSDGVIRRGDRIVIVAAQDLEIEPAPGDDLLIGSAVHRVVSVSTTYAGDRPAVFRLHVRR